MRLAMIRFRSMILCPDGSTRDSLDMQPRAGQHVGRVLPYEAILDQAGRLITLTVVSGPGKGRQVLLPLENVASMRPWVEDAAPAPAADPADDVPSPSRGKPGRQVRAE
jgi:hypothetical protein